jgi:glutaminyl-peptide cyclotransferase
MNTVIPMPHLPKFFHFTFFALLFSFIACTPQPTPTPTSQPTNEPTSTPNPSPQRLIPEIIATYPHDPTAFTQGLTFGANGDFIETTGLYGESRLRRVDLPTGESLAEVLLPPNFFGEGVAWTREEYVWLTWREGEAHRFDAELNLVGTWSYAGEGWGVCFDGEDLYMSDGTAVVTRRNPTDFTILDERTVTLNGEPVARLNELECVGEAIYANVWQADEIVVFAKESGVVTAVVNAANLLTPAQQAQLLNPSDDVLNGIAYDPSQDLFYLTGKRWGTLFAVRFVPAE